MKALVYLGEGSLTALPYVFNRTNRINQIEEDDMEKIKGVMKSYPNLFKWFEDMDEESFKILCKRTKGEMERLWDECKSEGEAGAEPKAEQEEVKEEQEEITTGKRTVKGKNATGATGEGSGGEA